MTQKKQPIEVLCSKCGTGFRLWVPTATVQEWGEEGGKINCIKCGTQHTILKGKKGFEAAAPKQPEAAKPATDTPPQKEKAPAPEEHPAEALETVLVIDDDKLAREMVKSTMKDVGIRLATAQNSAEAMKFIKNEQVDLIVTDLYLKNPGDPETLVDGEDILKKISDMGIEIPAIITTGKDIIDDFVLDPKWFDLRVKGFIQKGNPFWADELKLKIKEVLYKD